MWRVGSRLDCCRGGQGGCIMLRCSEGDRITSGLLTRVCSVVLSSAPGDPCPWPRSRDVLTCPSTNSSWTSSHHSTQQLALQDHRPCTAPVFHSTLMANLKAAVVVLLEAVLCCGQLRGYHYTRSYSTIADEICDNRILINSMVRPILPQHSRAWVSRRKHGAVCGPPQDAD